MHHYQPLTAKDKEEMLRDIGVGAFPDLLKAIPSSLLNPKMALPPALSELEIQAMLRDLGSKNRTVANTLSFLGGGSYEHFVPTAVGSITGRHEFYTAYTPYQPEAAQGTLQAIFEFQSLIAELMGLDVSNASHYDGSTSLAEAALLALRHTGRSKILVSSAVNPHYRQVLKTYLQGMPFAMEEFSFDAEGGFNREAFFNKLSEETAGVIFQ
nr:glycine dehydrogenase [Candidatus Omnitrophota bacterium]